MPYIFSNCSPQTVSYIYHFDGNNINYGPPKKTSYLHTITRFSRYFALVAIIILCLCSKADWSASSSSTWGIRGMGSWVFPLCQKPNKCTLDQKGKVRERWDSNNRQCYTPTRQDLGGRRRWWTMGSQSNTLRSRHTGWDIYGKVCSVVIQTEVRLHALQHALRTISWYFGLMPSHCQSTKYFGMWKPV